MDKIKKKKGFVCLLLLLSIIFTNAFPDRIVRAESVDHTHVWASTYDENHHWEYCTVCGETRNEEEHNFTDHWYLGYESCDYNNYCIKTCSCGYSYTYHKPHNWDNKAFSDGKRLFHYSTCMDCGTMGPIEHCYDKDGLIGCTNPGTCMVCGNIATENSHLIDSDGSCKFCHKQFLILSNQRVNYSDDFSTCTVTFKVTPVKDSGAVLTGKTNIGWSPFVNYETYDYTSEPVGDGTGAYNYKLVVYFKNNCSDVTNVQFGHSDELVNINGSPCYLDDYFFNETIWRDHTAPIVSKVNQTNQTEKDGWATIKRLDISGTEENSSYVHLSIEDSLTGEVLIEDATASVVDGKWSYSCTPPIEANEDGHDFMVKVYDDNNNTSTKDFTVYKADCIAPTLDCPTSYTDWTDIAKDITLTIKDGGVGSPQVSLGNQTSYKPCTNVNGKWQITYTFSEDIDGTEDYDLYLKDALGNARKVTITVGNIDKNKYTITYNLNGGSISGQKTTYTRTTETFKLPTPTKTGYTFTGWTGGNGTTAQTSVSIEKGSTGNKSYTANWTLTTYAITYDLGGGSIEGQKDSYDMSTETFTLPTPMRTGYTFIGWTGSNGTTAQTSVSVKNGSTGDKNFKANWKATSYNITYELNGGTLTGHKTNYTIETDTFTLVSPSRSGYTFTGWTGSNGTTAQKSVNIKKGSYGDLSYTANWSYDPIKVSMPQTLIGDKNGNSQFMVKSDDIKAGSIEVTFPKGFYYNQAGKNPVFASLLSDGSTTITKDNKAVKCKIITDGLTAGCWNGTFNIGLKLTK